MSRIGKNPIAVPAGVDIKIDGNTITVKGPKGEVSQKVDLVEASLEDGQLTLSRAVILKKRSQSTVYIDRLLLIV